MFIVLGNSGSLNIWIYIYGLTSLLNCEDSTENIILLEPYPEKEN